MMPHITLEDALTKLNVAADRIAQTTASYFRRTRDYRHTKSVFLPPFRWAELEATLHAEFEDMQQAIALTNRALKQESDKRDND